MKRALIPLSIIVLFCASGFVDAQFNLPTIPNFNPFAPHPAKPATPTTPAPSSGTANPILGMMEMAKGASGISLQDEMKIGGAVAVDIVSHNGGIDRDETMTHRVAVIGKSLAAYCSRPELKFRFAVLNSDRINAYSAPGGYVFITRGLYNSLPDDQQLAAVLAHEISHITKRHALKVISRSQFIQGLFDTAGSVTNYGAFDSGVNSITTSLFTKGFDPSAEFEADREGRSLATRVGYENGALLAFLKDLYKSEGDSKQAFPTHPPLSHRIDRLEGKSS
jgi:predicted Zn-dependent protease